MHRWLSDSNTEFSIGALLQNADSSGGLRCNVQGDKLGSTKIEAPKLPAELTFEAVQAYKSALRRQDAQRVAAGEATARVIQQQSAVIPPPWKAEVLHFPEAELLEA